MLSSQEEKEKNQGRRGQRKGNLLFDGVDFVDLLLSHISTYISFFLFAFLVPV